VGNQNKKVQLTVVTADSVETALSETGAELALALGLVRVLTLLRFHDPALDEVEQRLATAWDSLTDLQRLIIEGREGRYEGGDRR
jgi:hypothetical protein